MRSKNVHSFAAAGERERSLGALDRRRVCCGSPGLVLALDLRGERPHTDAASVDEIIAHYYTAIGGRSHLERITSRHVNVHAPGYEYSESFDGETWEYDFQSKKLAIDTGAAAAAGRRGPSSMNRSWTTRPRGTRSASRVPVEGGLLQPHHFIEREVSSGRLMSTLQWDSIRTNVKLGESAIRRPLP